MNLLGFSALFVFPEWIQNRGHKDVGIEPGIELWSWWQTREEISPSGDMFDGRSQLPCLTAGKHPYNCWSGAP